MRRLLFLLAGSFPFLLLAQPKKNASTSINTDSVFFSKMNYRLVGPFRGGRSAARNFEALIELLHDYPDKIMFCSDDKHPDSLVAGHINQLCARAVAKGIDLFKVLQAACVNPVLHYKLPVGRLRVNDPADFILVKDLENFEVLQTYIDGRKAEV